MTKGIRSFGTTIFCDDVREEVGGKKSFVGCYLGSLITHTGFPIVLPTFVIHIVFSESFEDAIGPLQIKVFHEKRDGERLALLEADLPSDRLSQTPGRREGDEVFTSLMTFRASPLILEEPGSLRVRAYRNNEEFKIGGLRIEEASSTEDSPNGN